MSEYQNTLFQAGGALRARSPVYIKRQADKDAAQQLQQMPYLKVIEPRQQGKTSLINHLMGCLDGYTFFYTDITTLDRNSEVSWYTSLGSRLLRKLSFIPENGKPPLPTTGGGWYDFLLSLAEQAQISARQVVITLDEIGAAELPWAEPFFSNLRAVYNERESEPAFRHITFVLVGVFNPRDLIKDKRVSPFNVARRLLLSDFDLDQISQLVAHLGLPQDRTAAIASRIQHWSDGQPYLTQLLCRYLAELESPLAVEDVDTAVVRLRREDDNHLPPILNSLDEKTELQDYAMKVLQGHQARFAPDVDRRHASLELIGAIKPDEAGLCRIRNRIYEQVFQDAFILRKEIGTMSSFKGGLESVSPPELIRLRHLADNIRQDLDLLKDYEDALRFAIDPRLRGGYRRDIEQLRKSAARYRQEYKELQVQITSELAPEMQDMVALLHEMDAKLDALSEDQTEVLNELIGLRKTLLARFDASEQVIVSAVVEQLDQNQLATVEAVLDAIEGGVVPRGELEVTVNAVQQVLYEIRQRMVGPSDPVLTSAVERLSEVVDAPKLDVAHKLKVTVPIIPLILSYEAELALKSGVNLEAAWRSLLDRIRSKQ